MREPAFWWRTPGAEVALLAPLAWAYGKIAEQRLTRPGGRIGLPVLCIGNLTHGGTGKSPTAMAVARLLIAAGERPFLLSRGYGGALAGPVAVDPQRHGAAEVGDEPLLLARVAPTIVARDRVAGAQAARAAGASVVVMDDGFQNPSLEKDLSIVVVDARRGIGNGGVFPAGPLRAPLAAQLARAHALLLIGPAQNAARFASGEIPMFHAMLAPDRGTLAALAGRQVLAFAGIGDPEKFFATLSAAGITIADKESYPDHHRFNGVDAAALLARAKRGGLALVTTEKDFARLGDPQLTELAARTQALPVSLVVEEADAFRRLVLNAVGLAA
jgi:tetraacyldisaccharide 4'-kinase